MPTQVTIELQGTPKFIPPLVGGKIKHLGRLYSIEIP